MNLKTLVRLQLCYAIAGLVYNVVSIVLVQQGSAALSPTSPVAGIVALVLYAISLLTCRAHSLVPYRVLMGPWLVVFGYGGVLKHLLNASSMDDYYSPAAWTMAIGINAFGLILNIMGAFGLFRENS